MKKCLAAITALLLLAACFCCPAQAASKKLVEVLMFTPGTTVDTAEENQRPTADDLDDALRAGSDAPGGGILCKGAGDSLCGFAGSADGLRRRRLPCLRLQGQDGRGLQARLQGRARV